MNVRPLSGALAFALALAVGAQADADVIYSWQTISATIGGAPTGMSAVGGITLSDAAAAQGTAAVASAPLFGSVQYDFSGIEAASFQMFTGPAYAVSATAPGNVVFNLTVAVNQQFLDFTGANQRFGGFAVDLSDSDAYYALGNGDLWTIGYGSDNPASPCYGGQIPGSGTNRCVVTGVFRADATPVPEPATLPLLASALLLWRLIELSRQGWRLRRPGLQGPIPCKAQGIAGRTLPS